MKTHAAPQQADVASNPEAKKSRIRQANALAKSGQELDLNEKRLLLLAMSRIKSTDVELLTHKIQMSELVAYLGENPYARAERAARGLLRRLVFVPTEHGGFKEFQWTTVAEYVPAESSETGESYVKIRLNEELAPLLLELRERYNSIPLLDLLPMESFNCQRLYELLWHDSHGGEKRVLTYEITDLKFSLGMRTLEQKGSKKIWKEKYKAWRDFRKVIERAQEEFGEHGRLRFTFDGLRKGRATQQVRFHLTLVKEGSKELEQQRGRGEVEPSPKALAVASELRLLGYTQDPVALVNEYGVDVVKQAIELGKAAERRSMSTTRPIKNLPGFIQHLTISGTAARSLELGKVEEKPQHDERELVNALKTSFEAYQTEVAENLFAELDEDTRSALPEMLRAELEAQNRKYLIELLKSSDWEGPHYQTARNTYLLDVYAQRLPVEAVEIRAFVDERGLLREQPDDISERVLLELEEELAV